MNELLVVVESTNLVKLLLDEVFHGFHVVVGDFLNVLHAASILLVEVTVDVSQVLEQSMIDPCQLRKRQLAKGNEIFNFHSYAVADERIL